MARLVYAFACFMLLAAGLSAQQVMSLQPGMAQASQGAQVNQNPSGNTATAAVPELVVHPTLVSRVLNVYVTGLEPGVYTMGLRRSDGSLINQWSGVLTGTHLVIDIEKVETGILTFFMQWSGGELSGSFRHTP